MRIFFLSVLIPIGVALTVIADVFLKKSNLSDWRYIAIGFVLYGLVALPVAAAFRFTEFGVLFMVWEVGTVAFGLFVGTVVFREPFTALKLMAFILAMGALGLNYLASR